MLTRVAFNLLLNSGCSFAAGLLIVYACIRIFRVDQSRWKLFLLTLPFAKIIWDLFVRRIPSSSIVNSGLNPLTLPPKHQTLTIGAGFSEYGPILNFIFTSRTDDGKIYSSSLADYIYAWFERHLGGDIPKLLLTTILVGSVFFVLRRGVATWLFERKRRQQRPFDRTLSKTKIDLRTIDIYASPKYEGTPFTGGVFHPYICFPAKTLSMLSGDETQAVIRHEVAHIKTWDLLVTMVIKSLGDFLWFVPGYRLLSRKIDRLREVLADQTATALGATPEHLASALLKLRETPEGHHHAVLHSAFFREKSLLKLRVESLLKRRSGGKGPRFGWNWLPIRILVTAWTTGAVMIATFAGNHNVEVHEIPGWFERFLKSMGWM